MASSRLVPTAGAPPPPSVMHTTPSERHPLKEVRTVARQATPSLPWGENSEAIILEHEEKVNNYQAELAGYMKAKYFSTRASDKGGRSLQPHCAAVPESRSRLPQANNSEAKDVAHEDNWSIREAEDLDHEEKVNKYQATLAARLKTKYFSSNAFEGLTGDMFEEITIQSETIRMSRSSKILLREEEHLEDNVSIYDSCILFQVQSSISGW